MAIFNVTGLDEAIKQLDLAADALKERAPGSGSRGRKGRSGSIPAKRARAHGTACRLDDR